MKVVSERWFLKRKYGTKIIPLPEIARIYNA
jgi:hypothetical protein